MLLQAYRWNLSASMTIGIARALVRARRRRYPKPENIVPPLYPLCLSITAVGAGLRVSVLCAYTRILPALSMTGVPTTPKSYQNLTRDLCFHVNICSLLEGTPRGRYDRFDIYGQLLSSSHCGGKRGLGYLKSSYGVILCILSYIIYPIISLIILSNLSFEVIKVFKISYLIYHIKVFKIYTLKYSNLKLKYKLKFSFNTGIIERLK